jgi:hypothetical protein
MELAKCVINHFRGKMSHSSYWGKPYPQLSVLRMNIRRGNYEQLGNRIWVEYGWSDAQVELEEEDGKWVFNNTIGSTL